ncbi:hypothetical protein BGW80DRAFT_1443767 [Lactifluus volemus]|nr:hypothetical protein BGW80DRAFT_1443767 [Lactifluus volemus]
MLYAQNVNVNPIPTHGRKYLTRLCQHLDHLNTLTRAMQTKYPLLIICINALVVGLFLSSLQVHLIYQPRTAALWPYMCASFKPRVISVFWKADCSFEGTKPGCPASNFYSHSCRSLVSTSL